MAKKKVELTGEAGVAVAEVEDLSEQYVIASAPEPAPAKITRYVVKAANPAYDGKTFGLKFESGRALLDPGAVDPRLGYDFDQVVLGFKNTPGYELIPVLPGADAWAMLRGIDLDNPEVRNEIAIAEQAARNTADRRRLLGAT